jgi:hypothetical protein
MLRQSPKDYQKRFLESVDFLTLFVLRSASLAIDDIAKESVGRSREATQESIKRLRIEGLVRNSRSYKQLSYTPSPDGFELIKRFEEAWEMIRRENSRIFPLKSYERLSVPRVIAEERRGWPV